MSATVETAPYRATEHRVTFGGLLRSEWIKFWSVRSIVVTTVVAFVAVVGIGVLLSWAVASSLADPQAGPAMRSGGFDATSASLQGAQLASLIVAAVGVIVMAGEFSTGMIRTSMSIAPGRLGVLVAKACVLAVSVAVVQGVAVLLAFLLGQSVLDAQGVGTALGDPGVARALVGNVVLLVGVALVGLAVGTLLRNSAGAICTVLAAIFVVPLLLLAVPASWGGDDIRRYYFTDTLSNVTSVTQQSDYLGVGAGLAAFAAWVLVLLLLGGLTLRSRDV